MWFGFLENIHESGEKKRLFYNPQPHLIWRAIQTDVIRQLEAVHNFFKATSDRNRMGSHPAITIMGSSNPHLERARVWQAQ